MGLSTDVFHLTLNITTGALLFVLLDRKKRVSVQLQLFTARNRLEKIDHVEAAAQS